MTPARWDKGFLLTLCSDVVYTYIMKLHRRINAFTFIEIVAAIAILAIGILSVLTLFPVGIDSSKKAGLRTKAVILGEKKIEEFKATTVFSSLASSPKTNFTTTDDPEQMYQYEIDVSTPVTGNSGTTTSSADSNLRNVTVTVLWPAKETDRKKQQKTAFSTYIGNR